MAGYLGSTLEQNLLLRLIFKVALRFTVTESVLIVKACFSFDVTDGSCSPHVALQSIADLLPSLENKFALLCIGDDRPTKHCEWDYESYCIVAVIGQLGNGPQLISVTHDSSKLNIDSTITG